MFELLNPSLDYIAVLKTPSRFSTFPDQEKANAYIRHLQRRAKTALKADCFLLHEFFV